MADKVLLCTDGSEPALHALREGWALLRPGSVPVIVTVVEVPDPMLLTGTGFAGGTMSPEMYDDLEQSRLTEARRALEGTAAALGLDGAEQQLLQGDAGGAICDHAAEIGAAAIVIGSRGQGGLRRFVLGSVSDHVVRHAPCPVVVTHRHED